MPEQVTSEIPGAADAPQPPATEYPGPPESVPGAGAPAGGYPGFDPGTGAPGAADPGYSAGTGYAPGTGYSQYAGYSGYGAGAPPGSYATTGYAYAPQAPRTDDKAIWALVSSVAGFILCPIVLHVVGWVLANQSLRAIRDSRGTLGGDGIARAARVLGIVGVVFYGVGALIAIAVFAVLIPLGIFAAGTAATSIDIGDETLNPTSITAIDGENFEHEAGQITYDLTALDFTDRSVDFGVQLGAGTLTVEVPDEVTVTYDAELGAGQLDAFGERTDGIGVSRSGIDQGDADGGSLVLDLDVGVGEIELTRG